ncbi:MAG: hypothetical protein AVDCRST_MAG38-2132, partial [uncultured Solirubrobacteraceae bacterium]
GRPARRDRREAPGVHRPAADLLRRQRAQRSRRPRQSLTEGPSRDVPGDRRAHRRLPRHDRQRRGDNRPRARERARDDHVLRVRGTTEHRAPLRDRPSGAARRPRLRRAGRLLRAPARDALRDRRRRHPHLGLLRLLDPLHALRRRARDAAQVGDQEGRGRHGRLSRRAQRREHRRPARPLEPL